MLWDKLKQIMQEPDRPDISSESAEFMGAPVKLLRRPYQRNMNLSVKPNGTIQVTCGKGIPGRVIWNFLEKEKTWIEKVQQEHEELRGKYPPKQFTDDETYLFMGRHLPMQRRVHQKQRPQFKLTHEAIICHAREENQSDELLVHLRKFYEKCGREILTERVEHWSQQMQLYPKKLSFRSQKTRWGSCSSEGHISLNWRLIAAPPEAIDYVVIHELAHLKHQDHSRRFWSLVEAYSSDHQYHRTWLRQHQYEFDFLAKNSELHL